MERGARMCRGWGRKAAKDGRDKDTRKGDERKRGAAIDGRDEDTREGRTKGVKRGTRRGRGAAKGGQRWLRLKTWHRHISSLGSNEGGLGMRWKTDVVRVRENN